MSIRKSLLAAALMLAASAMAQEAMTLPTPQKYGGTMSVIEALNTRHSTREFASTPLTLQELSNLCWAACGMTRDDNHRTAPTARNKQEIRLMVFTTEAVWEYDAKGNKLEKMAMGDHRKLLTSNGGGGFSQDFVLQAPVSLLMVIDFEKFGAQNEKAMQMGCVDAGIVSQNINLFCQATGLATVPRATMDIPAIRQLLGLSEKQLPIINNPVGRPIGTEELSPIPETIKAPVVLVDGVEISPNDLHSIDPTDIESVDVFKDSKTLEKIGAVFAPRKGGIVLITTKSKKFLRSRIKHKEEHQERLNTLKIR